MLLLLSLFLAIHLIYCERCPPVFGEFECPLGFTCKENQCFGSNQELSSGCTTQTQCSKETVCHDGKCYPLNIVKCNRHVLVGENRAHSIVSNCGSNGKCINGQCVVDICSGVDCGDGQLCQDGKCSNMTAIFCIGHADCGPHLSCHANKCQASPNQPICNCQPNELCHHGECYPNAQCTNVYCPEGSYCIEGQCINAIGRDCTADICHGGTVCMGNVCALNPCSRRCGENELCRLGECRLLEGSLCDGECRSPYVCIDGRCRRNDCALKVCQLGESCEGGNCVRVQDRFCTLAVRDCGESFSCVNNKCVDGLSINTKLQ